MIRCIIIDDEPLALKQMENYINKIPYLELVAACQSAIEAKEILEKEKIEEEKDSIYCRELVQCYHE